MPDRPAVRRPTRTGGTRPGRRLVRRGMAVLSALAGAGVALVHGGALLTSRGYGWADTGTDDGEPVLVDPARTLFRGGSVSEVVDPRRAVSTGRLVPSRR